MQGLVTEENGDVAGEQARTFGRSAREDLRELHAVDDTQAAA